MDLSSSTEVLEHEELTEDLAELGSLLVQLPPNYRERAESVFARVLNANRRRRRLLSLVRDSVSDMRLDIKYLQFDLEATRRERDELRREVEWDAEIEGYSGQEFEGEVDDP